MTTTAGVDVTTLNAFEHRRLDGLKTEIRMGDLVSRQAVSLVVRLKFPVAADGTRASAVFSLVDADGGLAASETDCTWTYASPAENDRQTRNVVVDREVAKLYAAKAREEALKLNQERRYDNAQQRLRVTGDRIRQYAGEDAMLNSIIGELAESDVTYASMLSLAAAKVERYKSYNAARMRAADGKARRHKP